MKKITLLFMGSVLLFGMISVTAFTTITSRPSANGQGSLTRPGDLQRRFAFHVNTMPNGDASGSGVLTITGGEAQIKFDINCLRVNGNAATMTGTVTSVSGNTIFQVGWDCWFKVVDNGEGSNANPDQITLLYGAANIGDCSIDLNVPLNPVEGGNIQVKP